MKLQAYNDKLKGMTRMPTPLREYAENVGAKLDDAKRATLMATLEVEYIGLVDAEDKRDKRQAQMADELQKFQKVEVTKLQKAAEKGEHDAAEASLDGMLDAA